MGWAGVRWAVPAEMVAPGVVKAAQAAVAIAEKGGVAEAKVAAEMAGGAASGVDLGAREAPAVRVGDEVVSRA